LAFSVVINMNPDILVIDEALAVGDSRFQRKCFRKLDDLRNGGTTILFVTHATDTVIAHCDRGIFVEDGRIVNVGDPKEVVNNYLESLFKSPSRQDRTKESDQQNSPDLGPAELSDRPEFDACRYRPSYNDTEYEWGNGEAKIFDYVVLDESGQAINGVVQAGSRATIMCAVVFEKQQKDIVYGLTIKTVDGTSVFGTNTERMHIKTENVEPGEIVYVRFDMKLDLISSEYFFSLGVIARNGIEEDILHRRYDLFRIKVQDDNRAFGYASLPVSIRTAGSREGIAGC
jgi:lipopolysaccharide transport system ATP-binding protein